MRWCPSSSSSTRWRRSCRTRRVRTSRRAVAPGRGDLRGAAVARRSVDFAAQLLLPAPTDRTPTAEVPSRAEAARIAHRQAALGRVATHVAGGGSEQDLVAVINQVIAELAGVDISLMMRFESDDTAVLLAASGLVDDPALLGRRLRCARTSWRCATAVAHCVSDRTGGRCTDVSAGAAGDEGTAVVRRCPDHAARHACGASACSARRATSPSPTTSKTASRPSPSWSPPRWPTRRPTTNCGNERGSNPNCCGSPRSQPPVPTRPRYSQRSSGPRPPSWTVCRPR